MKSKRAKAKTPIEIIPINIKSPPKAEDALSSLLEPGINPHTIIKSLRNAAFLEGPGAVRLPLAYLLTAVTMGFVVALHSKLQATVQRKALLVFTLIFFVINCLLFWWIFPLGWNWLPLMFWVWANICTFALITQFWISVNDVLNPREAKRLIGFFGSGGILGGIIGGLSVGFLVEADVLTPHNLLLLASSMFLLGILLVL